MRQKAAKKKAPAKRVAKRKKTEKVEEQTEVAVEASGQVLEMGPPPSATVLSRYQGTMHERHAKGFSFGELSAVGVTPTAAKGLRVSIDIRRRSVLDGNVELLKGWYKVPPKQPREPAAPQAEKGRKKKTTKSAKKAARKTKKEEVAAEEA